MRLLLVGLVTTFVLMGPSCSWADGTLPPGSNACLDMRATPPPDDYDGLTAYFDDKISGFGVRLVLAVGNAYEGQPAGTFLHPTDNAARDAVLVAELFRKMHYDVLCLQNATFNQMLYAAHAIGSHRPSEGLVVLYFAGHGYSLKGRNYVVANDANGTTAANIRDASWAPSELLATMAGNRSGLLLLDSCRDDLTKDMPADSTFHFSQVLPDRAFADYAAGDGQTAYDWPTNKEKQGLFATEAREVLAKKESWVQQHPFYIVLHEINVDVEKFKDDTPNFVKRSPQLAPNLSEVATWMSPSEDWSDLVKRVEQYLDIWRHFEDPTLVDKTAPGDTPCKAAYAYREELNTLDSSQNPSGERILAARSNLQAAMTAARCGNVAELAPSMTRTMVSVPPVVVSAPADAFAISDRMADALVLPTGGKTINFRAGFALYGLQTSLAVDQVDGGRFTTQVASAPSLLEAPPSTSASLLVGLVAPTERAFAAIDHPPAIIPAAGQAILRFAQSNDASLDDVSFAEVTRLVAAAPSKDTANYILLLSSSAQGPNVTTDELRLSTNRIAALRLALLKAGVQPAQIVEPNLALAPELTFSNLSDSQAVIVRGDPRSVSHTPDLREMISRPTKTVNWIDHYVSLQAPTK